jgi:hypothetical protein
MTSSLRTFGAFVDTITINFNSQISGFNNINIYFSMPQKFRALGPCDSTRPRTVGSVRRRPGRDRAREADSSPRNRSIFGILGRRLPVT